MTYLVQISKKNSSNEQKKLFKWAKKNSSNEQKKDQMCHEKFLKLTISRGILINSHDY